MKRIICVIVACGVNHVIGNKGKIPWNIPSDLAYFKRITGNRPIIMGRKTHESIGRVLPGRKNIVISSQKDYKPKTGAFLAKNLEEALVLAGKRGRVFIIGGGQLYAEVLPLVADRIYLTSVHATFEGDVFLPKISPEGWRETYQKTYRPNKECVYYVTRTIYERKK